MASNNHDHHNHDLINPYQSTFRLGEDLKKTHPHQKKAMVIVRDTRWVDAECRDRKQDTANWSFG